MLNSSQFRLKRSHSLAVGLVLILSVAAGLSVRGLVGPPEEACLSLSEGKIVESQRFVPYENRLTHLPELPLNPTGAPPPQVSQDSLIPTNSLAGLPLQWAVVGTGGVLGRYFWDRPIDANVTRSEFLAAGGIEFGRGPSDWWQPEELAAFHGERAQIVEVGPHKAILTWADPEANGVRPHDLTWSDGTYNYTLVADLSAVQLVNLARGMVCGSSPGSTS